MVIAALISFVAQRNTPMRHERAMRCIDASLLVLLRLFCFTRIVEKLDERTVNLELLPMKHAQFGVSSWGPTVDVHTED